MARVDHGKKHESRNEKSSASARAKEMVGVGGDPAVSFDRNASLGAGELSGASFLIHNGISGSLIVFPDL